jgi:hypothetical protein
MHSPTIKMFMSHLVLPGKYPGYCLCKGPLLSLNTDTVSFTSYLLGGVRVSPLGGTPATIWPLLPDQNDDYECGAIGGTRIGTGIHSSRRKPVPVPLCRPQIPQDMIHAATVGSKRLTVRDMALPSLVKHYRTKVLNIYYIKLSQ